VELNIQYLILLLLMVLHKLVVLLHTLAEVVDMLVLVPHKFAEEQSKVKVQYRSAEERHIVDKMVVLLQVEEPQVEEQQVEQDKSVVLGDLLQ